MLRRLLSIALCAGTILSSVVSYAGEEDRNRELRELQYFGLYIRDRGNTSHVNSAAPLASLDPESIQDFLDEHPELEGQRVVLVLPSLLGQKDLIAKLKAELRQRNLPDDIELIRHSSGKGVEPVLDFFPRKQDWEPSIPREIREAHISTFGGEFLSLSLFTYLAIVGEILPEIAIAAAGVNLVQIGLLYYPIRFWSNYFNRINVSERFLANFIITCLYSTNFYLLFHATELGESMAQLIPSVLVSSIFFTAWRTTVSSSAFLWETAKNNALPLEQRRSIRSVALTILQLVLSPFHAYSLMPGAHVIFQLPHMDLNAGHLVMAGAGVMGAFAWIFKEKIAAWSSRKLLGAEKLKRVCKCR